MNIQSRRQGLLATTAFIGIGFACAAPAFAQDAPIQEVVVTGSRIPQPNLASASPVVSVSIQEAKLEGNNDIADLLAQLPQVGTASVGNTPNPLNGNGGFTTVDLRNLGSNRTLVLQDGKRLQPGDPLDPFPDLDQIPSALIDRVEVLTGGASAVYGSDAIAGVVNFIMKHNFQGVQLDAQYGFDQHDNDNTFIQGLETKAGFPVPSGSVVDGQVENVSGLIGVNSADGKGNIEVYATYRHQEPVTEGTRDFSACLLTAAKTCSGSGTDMNILDADSGNEYTVVGNTLVPYAAAGRPVFNSSPYETLSKYDERYTAGFLAHYDFSQAISVYDDFSFLDDQDRETTAPGGIFLGTGTVATGDFQVPCNSPLLSAQEVGVLCTANGVGPTGVADIFPGRRNVEGGGRINAFEHIGFRNVVGIKGVLGDVWHYDASVQLGYTTFNNQQLNFFSTNAFQAALNNGTYHLFTQGGVTPADLATVDTYGTAQGSTLEQVATANIGGDLGHYGIRSPFANDGIGVNVGTEYRREATRYLADANLGSGDINGGSGASPPLSAAFDVYELFGEVRIPLVQDKPFIKDLNASYGYRFSDYSSSGDIDTLKYTAEYAPTKDIRFRASFQRATRAPDINELFTPTTVTQTSSPGVDPCATTVDANGNLIAATATLAQCQRTAGAHITAAQIATLYGNGGTTDRLVQCPAGQCAESDGGNAALKPEKSNTTSFGFIFTPTFVRNFDLSIDYYKIDLKGEITGIDPGVTLNQCLDNDNLCQFVNRSANGFLFGNQLAAGGYIEAQEENIGYQRTSGFDIASNYRIGISEIRFPFSAYRLPELGRLSFSLDATYENHDIISPGQGLGNYECAGYFGSKCGLTPNFRSKLRVTWATPWSLQVSAQWRYIGGASLDANQSNPLTADGHDAFDARISAISYLDTSILWKFHDGYQLRAGVNNVLDQDPPLIAQAIVGSGLPNTFNAYDILGRTFFIGITADF